MTKETIIKEPCEAPGADTESLFSLLAALHRGTFLYLRRGEEGSHRCPPPYMLAIADREGLSQDELAWCLRIDKGAVAKKIKQMEEDGFVVRRQDEKDRRKNGIFLTDKGRAKIPGFRARAAEAETYLAADLTEKEKKVFKDFLRRSAAGIYRGLEEERGKADESDA